MNGTGDKLSVFLNETTAYFLRKIEGVERDKYFADRDIRYILDKSINDIILCVVDLAEEILKKNKKAIPDTYKDTILATHEFIGDVALTLAPLPKFRNETIHQYLKINWENIQAIKTKLPAIREFSEKTRKHLSAQSA